MPPSPAQHQRARFSSFRFIMRSVSENFAISTRTDPNGPVQHTRADGQARNTKIQGSNATPDPQSYPHQVSLPTARRPEIQLKRQNKIYFQIASAATKRNHRRGLILKPSVEWIYPYYSCDRALGSRSASRPRGRFPSVGARTTCLRSSQMPSRGTPAWNIAASPVARHKFVQAVGRGIHASTIKITPPQL